MRDHAAGDERAAGRPRPKGAGIAPWFLRIAAGAGLAMLGSYLLMLAWIKFGGAEIESFCRRELVGRSGDEVVALADAAGLVVRRQPDRVRVKDNPRLSGHACDALLIDGRVARARSTFLF